MEIFIIVFLFVILPLVIAANIADNKSRNVIVWALLGTIFGWLAVIVVACLSDKTVNELDKKREELKKDLEIQILQNQLNKLKNA